MRTGISLARGDLVLIQDADLEYDPEEWPRLLAPLLRGRAKVVYGSRYLGEREATSLLRWAGDRSLSLLTTVLFNTTISDIETGYKLIDREVLDSLDLDVRPVRLRARDHGQAAAPRLPHLRGAGDLRRAGRAPRAASSPGATGWPRPGPSCGCGCAPSGGRRR